MGGMSGGSPEQAMVQTGPTVMAAQAAAQAQVNMRQLNLEYQKTQALAALEDKHNADLIKQEDARAAVADKLL